MLPGVIIGTCIFLLNTLRIDNLYFRPDSDNKKQFTLKSLLKLIVAPFKMGIMWNTNMITFNWIVIVVVTTFFYRLVIV
jgi:putative effector of murein hydrolase LrgA (UPF0299 family)